LEAANEAKLAAAQAEIADVFARHDVAGLVIIHTPGLGRFQNFLSPSWSCAVSEVNEKGEGGLRFRTSIAANGVEGRNHKLKSTANMLQSICDMLDGLRRMLELPRQHINKHVGATHDKGTWRF
jgi:hypothetical protein